ncbi:MAG: glycerophosphodiester phosphodiesterase family protein [Clostridia bacterium]
MDTDKNLAWLTATRIAHRGLHDNIVAPENSMLAFKKAVDAGYGIEFDVYLTNDGKVIVHHDPTLQRTVGQKIKAVDIDTDHLENYKLMNTNENIPLLTDMLALVDGKVNLVIEIKTTRFVNQTCEALWQILKDYRGNFCVESFNTDIVKWWHINRPQVIVGQLYSPYPWLRARLMAMRQYKIVDFLAVCIENTPSLYNKKLRAKYPQQPHICWTVRKPKQQQLAEQYCDNYIFETNAKNPDYIAPPTPNK